MMYSQNAEEAFILAYFTNREPARWLDVGAYDGRSMSNTLALSELDWGGVAVEPDPQAFEGLQRTYGGNPKIAILPLAISSTGGVLPFHNSRSGGVSTLSDAHRRKWESAATFETIEVETITPDELLRMHPGPYAFMSLDVESANVELLELFDLSAMGVELLCVEHDGEDTRILEHCTQHGLERRIYRSGENLIVGK